MSAIKIYRMNDCDWAAVREYENLTGAARREILMDKPVPLTDAQLDTLRFTDDPYDENAATRSFREQLNRRVQNGETVDIFATTEF